MPDVFASHPLEDFLKTAPTPNEPRVSVEIIEPAGMAQVFAAKGKAGAIEKALKVSQMPGQAMSSQTMTAMPLAPGQWLMIASEGGDESLAATLRQQIGVNGHVSEQSDARVVFRISGPATQELMQKGCRLDLQGESTGKDWCAQTQMVQIGVLIHQIDDAPVYDLYVYSGFAQHFAEWLSHTGAQLAIAFNGVSGR